MDKFTEFTKVILGSVITAVSGFLGGMDGIMYALLAFVTIDYVTGVAAAFKRHELSSEVGFWGIVKKVCIISLVGVGHFIDVYVMRSGDVFRTAIALYYIGNEGISLLENFSRLGVVYPKKIKKFLKQLRDENDDNEEDKKK